MNAQAQALAEQLLDRLRAEKAATRYKSHAKEAREASTWKPIRQPKAYVAKKSDLDQAEA